MDRSCVIYLCKSEMVSDEFGVQHRQLTERKVYAQRESVTRAEFFNGGMAGFKPDYKFIIFAPEFKGEDVVKYSGLFYDIYRTYEGKGDSLELYVEKRKGIEDGDTNQS